MLAKNSKWVGDNLWYLLNLTPEQLKEKFPDCSIKNLQRRRQEYNKKFIEGKLLMPPAPNQTAQDIIDKDTRQHLHELLDRTIDEQNINPEHISKFRLTSGTHEGYIKNSDGEIEYTKQLRRGGISLIVEPEKFEPKWDIIRRVESKKLPYAPKKQIKTGGLTREVILPDMQIGYRKYDDGTIDPLHDTKAIDVALQLIREVRPSRVILLGDFLDLPNFGKYLPSAEFAQTTNLSLEYGHNLLKTIRGVVPEAEIIFLEGNHSQRLEKCIKANMMEAYGIKRVGESLPVLSIPYLMALDTLDVKYVGGYPAGRFFITPTLQCIHGEILGKHTMSKLVTEYEGVSTIHGHAHRWQSFAKTTRIFEGARQTYAFSLGTLSRIDGAVPGFHSSTDVYGKPVISHEDWQQMIGIVTHDGESWSLQPVFIDTLNGYKTFFENKLFTPME